MKCPKCGSIHIAMEQDVGIKPGGILENVQWANCLKCKLKWNLYDSSEAKNE